MIKDEQAGFDLIGDGGEFDRRSMILPPVLLELRRVPTQCINGVDFVNESVAPAAVGDEGLRWRGVTRNYDGAILCLDPETARIGSSWWTRPLAKCRCDHPLAGSIVSGVIGRLSRCHPR